MNLLKNRSKKVIAGAITFQELIVTGII